MIVSARTVSPSFPRIALIALAAFVAIVAFSSIGNAGTPTKTRRASGPLGP